MARPALAHFGENHSTHSTFYSFYVHTQTYNLRQIKAVTGSPAHTSCQLAIWVHAPLSLLLCTAETVRLYS